MKLAVAAGKQDLAQVDLAGYEEVGSGRRQYERMTRKAGAANGPPGAGFIDQTYAHLVALHGRRCRKSVLLHAESSRRTGVTTSCPEIDPSNPD